MKPLALTATDPAAMTSEDVALGAASTDRRRLFRLMECHLLHRGDWQYLETRHQDGNLQWPIDTYRCDRCERTWERTS